MLPSTRSSRRVRDTGWRRRRRRRLPAPLPAAACPPPTLLLLTPIFALLTPAVLDSLFEQLRKAQRNPEVKAIVLTGAHGEI